MSILGARDRSDPNAPSFTLQNRIYRAAWKMTWFILGAWTPTPMHRWRRALLRVFGATVDDTAEVYSSAKIWSAANITMGAYSTVGQGAILYSMDRIELGDYVVVSQGSHLCAGSHYIESPTFQLYTRPIKIENHAWLAADSFVGPGVTVGEGAVLGARGCAFSNLEPWTVYVGNPAKPIKKRVVRGNPGWK